MTQKSYLDKMKNTTPEQIFDWIIKIAIAVVGIIAIKWLIEALLGA